MLAVFHRFIARPLFKEPLRTLLTLFAVSLGVAVVLAIDLAGDAAAGSFQSSVESLAGDADLEVTATGGLDEKTVGTLATLPHAIRIKPRIENYATLADTSEVLPFLGLDLVADALEEKTSADLTGEEGIWVSPELKLQPGSRVRVLLQDRIVNLLVSGVYQQSGRAIVADIGYAQELLRQPGKIDRILLWMPKGADLDEWIPRLKSLLPADATVARQGARTRENQRMLEAFRWNLRVLSYIALVVGAFLIYNTVSVSVVRRRSEIGILRAIGATRNAILLAFLGEAAIFGILGGILGTLLGRIMAEGAVTLIGATVESLYVSSQPGLITLHWTSVAYAIALGLAISVISALSPALEAARVSPTEAMARGRSDYLQRIHKGRYLLLATFSALAAAALSQLEPIGGKPFAGYVSALLLIAAGAMAIPSLVDFTSRTFSSRLTVEAMLAFRSLAGSLRRTSVLVAALTTAVAMMVSVGIMVGSFRATVLIWMENQLTADLYLRPAGPSGADRYPTLAADLPERIQDLPEIAFIDRYRAYPISYQGLPATLASGEKGTPEFLSGDRDAILTKLGSCDCVIISEPFSNKHRIKTGDSLHLPMGSFEVLGVYYDYSSERGTIIMNRQVMLKYLPDPAPSNIALWIKPDVDIEQAKKAVERASAGSKIVVFANRTLREEAIKIFDRTFAITYALEAVAVIVAVMGVAGALLALVIDRKRELALLRFLGASQQQIRRMVLSEAGLLGLLANLAGGALGLILSLILVFVINRQSFGWTIQFHWPVAILLGGLTIIYLATILSGLYPARIATKLNPIEEVHEE